MRICADSCFLIALYDETDGYHSRALACFGAYIERGRHSLLVPWPVMYESVSTRMARAPARMARINTHLKTLRLARKLDFLDDTGFREAAITQCFAVGAQSKPPRSLSLVDCVVREMLSDKTLQTHALATFNVKDFYDICRKFRKAMLP
jgi:predicted nucleic acid-binding protein